MGYFNLPNIDWGNHVIKPNSGFSTIAANKLLTIMEEHGLTQHVRIPTHTQGHSSNFLDIVLTNIPDLIKNQNQNQNRFIRSYYRPRRPPPRPIWSLSQRPPGKNIYMNVCM